MAISAENLFWFSEGHRLQDIRTLLSPPRLNYNTLAHARIWPTQVDENEVSVLNANAGKTPNDRAPWVKRRNPALSIVLGQRVLWRFSVNYRLFGLVVDRCHFAGTPSLRNPNNILSVVVV